MSEQVGEIEAQKERTDGRVEEEEDLLKNLKTKVMRNCRCRLVVEAVGLWWWWWVWRRGWRC